jgi:Bacterial Ig-like domain (group 1)
MRDWSEQHVLRAKGILTTFLPARLQCISVLAPILFVFCAAPARAGGPKYIAGSSYFNSGIMGQPLTWSQGQINYYTDQGDLSPILPNATANSFVASSFSVWTSVSIASLTANAAGELAEDVNGSNIEVSNGVVTAPADITPEATEKPVGIVYDYDGSVTDALLGSGAGDSSQCFWNAVFGGVDNFGATANFLHALIVINGQCALQSSQLTDLEYRLVRVLGGVIGLDWSQLNLNVITGDPPPTQDDFAGFPVDMAALSRLYPPASPPSSTARIYGNVYFTNHAGGMAQAMQGVNVYARWIDPSTGLPSHQYGVSSVSGFLFTGNAGNPITGWDDPFGNAYSEFGSSNQTIEGFFDLAGLPVPNAASSAQYQLSIEAVDPLWSAGVGPYAPNQVAPSGTFDSMTITVNAGGEFEQDVLMSDCAQPVLPWSATETWTAPAPVPAAGDWVETLSGYGDVSYFLLPARANRTLSVEVTAMDETGAASESKAEPVVGMWTLGDAQGTLPPALTTSPFNSETFAMTLLNAQIYNSNSFIIGISDLRGDGRPDYQYHAHILYGDSVVPSRLPVAGGAITLQGTGFTNELGVSVGATPVPLLATNASQILLNAPAQSDGAQTVTVTDPASGASSIMTDVVTFGAAASDTLLLIASGNPPTPVGTQSINPVVVRVVASGGVTPVSGATVAWSTTNNATLSACGGAPSCSVVSDEGGLASTFVTPTLAGNVTIAAELAPAVYNPPQTVIATMTTSPAENTNIAVTTPYLWIAQGASVSVPLTAQVVNQNGSPLSDVKVDFFFASGSGSLSAPNATTNSAGYATVTLTATNLSGSFQVNACVAPNNAPCQNIYGNSVAPALLNLQPVFGAAQVVAGTGFQPLTVRVTDSSTPPNPVLAANVSFQSTVLRPLGNDLEVATGAPSSSQTGMPVILSSAQTSVQSNVSGLASFTPTVGSFNGTLEVAIQVSAGTMANLQDVMESLPETYIGTPPAPNPPGVIPAPRSPDASPVGLSTKPARYYF